MSTAEMAKKDQLKHRSNEPSTATSDENTARTLRLDRRYQQIGISAVAAAVRYQGAAKNPAYAPAETIGATRIGDAAA